MSGPDPREVNRLMDRLQPAVLALVDAWRESGCDVGFEPSVVVAGTRQGVRAVVPSHDGAASYAVVMATRAVVVARLRAVGEDEVAASVEAGSSHGPEAVDVVVASGAWIAVVDLVPDESTAPGGAA